MTIASARALGQGAQPDTAQLLEQLAGELHSVAFDFREPSRSINCSDRRIDRVEGILERARAAVRGSRAERG